MDAMEPIWARPERAARGPRPAHSRDAVAAAAVRIADAEGIEAVSMRRVAAALGAGTTSLYRYLTGKDDLLDLMADAVMAERTPPAPSGDWRADLRVLAGEARAAALAHPWFPAVTAARPGLGPGALRWTEAWLAALDGLGLSPDAMLTAVTAVRFFVDGAVVSELAQRGLDMDAWMGAQGAYGDAIISGGRYPRLARVMVEAEGPHVRDRAERAFRDGLEHVLDGIARRIRRS